MKQISIIITVIILAIAAEWLRQVLTSADVIYPITAGRVK